MLFNKEEIIGRIEKFQKKLQEGEIEVAIIHHNADIFYYTGTVGNGYLLIPSYGEPIFALKRGLERVRELSPISEVVLFKKSSVLRDIIFDVAGGSDFRTVGISMDTVTVQEFRFLENRVCPSKAWKDVSFLIRQQRAVKSEAELKLMEKAAELGDYIYSIARDYIKPGLSEWELCAYLEYEAKRKGNLGLVRARNPHLEITFGHVLSGPDGSAPSYGDTPTGGMGLSPAFAQGSCKRVISEGDIVSIDTMLCFDGYLNDQTRNLAVGLPNSKLLKAHEISIELHNLFRDVARPGVTGNDIYYMIMQKVKKYDLFEFFMGVGNDKVAFVGHGIGIEVDEFPFIAPRQEIIIEEGMTVAFEPKFIIPGEGVAGIENTYVITSEGARSLNKSPEELVILRA